MSITARIDAITAIPEAYRATILPAPRSVKVELTANCNYHCKFCVKSLRADNRTMDRAFYSRILREMRAAGVEELGVFYIGESFTCKWLPEAIKEAKDLGFPYVFLTTNGSAATPQRVEACMAAGLDSLKFSLNYADEQQLAEIAGVAPSMFRRVLHHIKTAREIRDKGDYACRLYASSIRFNDEQQEKMRAVVEEVRPHVEECYELPLYGMSGAAKSAGYAPKPGNPGRLGALRDPLPCWAAFTEGHITAAGELAACCFGTGLDGALIMADLNSTPFMEAWNSAAFQALRAAHLAQDVSNTGCAECVAA